MNSKADAELGGYSRHHTRFRLTISSLSQSRSRQEHVVTCTWGFLMIREFASNVYECILSTTHKRQLGCVIDAVAFPVRHR